MWWMEVYESRIDWEIGVNDGYGTDNWNNCSTCEKI